MSNTQVNNIQQRTDDWFELRKGKFTASKADNLLGKLTLKRTKDKIEHYAQIKAGELYFGLSQEENYISKDMQRGIDLEPLAFGKFQDRMRNDFLDAFESEFVIINEHAGASPDGLVSNGDNLEIKCPTIETFNKLVLTEEINPKYFAQMQMQMLATNASQPAMLCQGYVLMNVEPEHDVHNAQQALRSLDEADFVVALSSFKGKATEYADVLLPIAPFTETSGTFVNTEGRVQTFNGVVSTLGETRPAWKVIRVLGNLLTLDGFDYETSEQVRAEVIPDSNDVSAQLNNKRALASITVASKSNGKIERIGEVPIYQADPIVRRAESLQQTNDAASPCAWMSPDLLQKLSIRPGDEVKIIQNDSEIRLLAASDEKLPADCVRLVSAHAKTSELGSMFGEILIEKL